MSITILACYNESVPTQDQYGEYFGEKEIDAFFEMDPFGGNNFHLNTPQYLDRLFKEQFSKGITLHSNFNRSVGNSVERVDRTTEIDGKGVVRSILTYGAVSQCKGIIDTINQLHPVDDSEEGPNFVIVIYNMGRIGRLLLCHVMSLLNEENVEAFNFFGFPAKWKADDLAPFNSQEYLDKKIMRLTKKTPANHTKPVKTESLDLGDDSEEELEEPVQDTPPVAKKPVRKSKEKAEQPASEEETPVAKKRTTTRKKAVKTEDDTSTKKTTTKRTRTSKTVDKDNVPASEESMIALANKMSTK